jgi:hypothetical protein
MIVQIRNATDDMIETLMHATGSKTASGAFVQAAVLYVDLQLRNHELSQKLSASVTENKLLRARIESARSAAAALLDKTSQQDLDV